LLGFLDFSDCTHADTSAHQVPDCGGVEVRPGFLRGARDESIDAGPVHVHDLRSEQAYLDGDEVAVRAVDFFGVRTLAAVPMLKAGQAVGVMSIYRQEVRPFTDNQIALVSNFAAQAGIAIENARLMAHHGLTAEVFEINRRAYPAPPGRKSAAARAVLERSVVQIPDVNADPDYALGDMAATGGYRSGTAVPMLRDGLPIGAIALTRAQAGPLPDRQIELLKTFADQAVIAIENVRLFDEVQARTRELSQFVEELRALGEVSQAVNSTLDADIVLTTIVAKAVELSGTEAGAIYTFDDSRREFWLRATHGMDEAMVAAIRDRSIGAGETRSAKRRRNGRRSRYRMCLRNRLWSSTSSCVPDTGQCSSCLCYAPIRSSER
jgi:GAF domain-containing protein